MSGSEETLELPWHRGSSECSKSSIFLQNPFLLCFPQTSTKIRMFDTCVKLYLEKSNHVSFPNKLPAFCTSNMDVLSKYQAKKGINLQPVIQIRPAVNSSPCREVLWPSILEKLTVVQEICVNFTN